LFLLFNNLSSECLLARGLVISFKNFFAYTKFLNKIPASLEEALSLAAGFLSAVLLLLKTADFLAA
jgi:hypothetical protein